MTDCKMQLRNKLLKLLAKLRHSNYNVPVPILHEIPFRNHKYLYNWNINAVWPIKGSYNRHPNRSFNVKIVPFYDFVN